MFASKRTEKAVGDNMRWARECPMMFKPYTAPQSDAEQIITMITELMADLKNNRSNSTQFFLAINMPKRGALVETHAIAKDSTTPVNCMVIPIFPAVAASW